MQDLCLAEERTLSCNYQNQLQVASARKVVHHDLSYELREPGEQRTYAAAMRIAVVQVEFQPHGMHRSPRLALSLLLCPCLLMLCSQVGENESLMQMRPSYHTTPHVKK
jgi:hypothetical protein